MQIKLTVVVSTLFLMTIPIVKAQQQDCAAVLGYVQDITKNDQVSNFRRLFCEHGWSQANQNLTSGGKVVIPYYDLPVQGNLSLNNQMAQGKDVCELIDSNSAVHQLTVRANADVVAAWERCTESQGIHLWATVDRGDSTVTIKARYSQRDTEQKDVKVLGPISWWPTNGMNCAQDQRDLGVPGLIMGRYLDGRETAVTCTQAGNQPVHVKLRTAGGDRELIIPAIAPPPRKLVLVEPPNQDLKADTTGRTQMGYCKNPGDHSRFNVCGPYARVKIECAGCEVLYGPLDPEDPSRKACGPNPASSAVGPGTPLEMPLGSNESLCLHHLTGLNDDARVTLYKWSDQ
jgi:hypothetical protein